jgi:transposase-like protein
MKTSCPNSNCACPELFIKDGKFKRQEDSKFIQRYRCKSCGTRFSSATFTWTYRQKKRRVNSPLLGLLASGVSMRRAAELLKIHKNTVELKLPFLAARCRRLNDQSLKKFSGRIFNMQIDDLITKENSKLKPLSVSIAVDSDRRLILGAEVSQIPAFGHLARFARKKYGERKDEHSEGLTRLFKRITPLVNSEVLIKSDEHQRYPSFISGFIPKAKHMTFKSERGCVVGQGELKKIGFDPLFAVNHTCALLRANINRLIRKTWCTTKDKMRLKDHLDVFIYFYNKRLIKHD